MEIKKELINKRIIFINGEIDDEIANDIIEKLLFLVIQDSESDIKLYINSPGGDVTSAFAIYDTIQHIPCDVETIGIGMTASMGAFLLSSGTKGKRYALPNTEIMLHQISSGSNGKITEMKTDIERIISTQNRINKILAQNTGKTIEQIKKDCQFDNFMLASKAKKYGLIDKVLKKEKYGRN